MTYRKKMDTRTWLNDREYDLLALPGVLHWDLFAYTDLSGAYWFSVEARQSGQRLIARSLFRLDPATGQLEARTMAPQLTPVVWDRRTHDVFRRVHRALLLICEALPGYSRVSKHCHYVPVPDCDPWPRGVVNTYKYTTRPDDPRKLPRSQRAPVVGAPLPDLL